jgi:hypothetical protein
MVTKSYAYIVLRLYNYKGNLITNPSYAKILKGFVLSGKAYISFFYYENKHKQFVALVRPYYRSG